MEQYIESVGQNHWDLMAMTLAQVFDEDSARVIGERVTSLGKYSHRATNKNRGSVSVDKLEGETKYGRPNGDTYYSRPWGEHSDVEVLRRAREATGKRGKSPLFSLLYGAPGCGKTALVEASFGDLYTLMGTGDTEVADLVGGYIQTKDGGFEWRDGDLVRAAEEGAVYFIDEVGLIDPKVLSVVYGLMDGRQELTITANPDRGTVKAKPGFYVVAATNPNAPGVRLSEALLSRFTVQVEMTTDWDLARKLKVSPRLVAAAQMLAKKQLAREVTWAPQMRELLAFRDISELYGTNFALSNLLAQAPEMDRPMVTDIITRAFAEEHRPARI